MIHLPLLTMDPKEKGQIDGSPAQRDRPLIAARARLTTCAGLCRRQRALYSRKRGKLPHGDVPGLETGAVTPGTPRAASRGVPAFSLRIVQLASMSKRPAFRSARDAANAARPTACAPSSVRRLSRAAVTPGG